MMAALSLWHEALDPASGRTLIEGRDLRDVRIESLRRHLGVVPQEPFPFAGPLRDNIRFAAPDASDDRVWEALRVVGVVERLPDGLDTVVQERGQSRSSGARQLVALARAFLAQPRVLVLDEATSNVDLQSESKIEKALDVLLEGRSAILIAHKRCWPPPSWRTQLVTRFGTVRPFLKLLVTVVDFGATPEACRSWPR
jgi:ATP-binding cassette, subfamily B, bacterial